MGTSSGDRVGCSRDGCYDGVTELSNGNYLVRSRGWDNGATANAGAVTWGSGTAGVSGVLSAANSLVGTTANDRVGCGDSVGYCEWGLVELSNGNYLVHSVSWDNGAVTDAGAVTWGSGTAGVSGVVSSANSLVGGSDNDRIGWSADSWDAYGVIPLSNGHYLVVSELWDNGSEASAGAVTWGNGTTGIQGVVSAANSLVGSEAGDQIGSGGVTELSNGNYVISSPSWHGSYAAVGAVTWGSGTAGVQGVVSAANSLVGSKADDQVGSQGVTALSNGNYVVLSPMWDNGSAENAGAATWADGTTGIQGAVSAANSLVGNKAEDMVGVNVTALSNGNYVVSSSWSNGTAACAGAATWGNGATGTVGVVSAANSLVGTTADDGVGRSVTALSNGNYVVWSPTWHKGVIANAGAVTWGDGTGGTAGVVSPANSLVGSSTDDMVGCGDYYCETGVIALSNGNYLAPSLWWDNGTATNAGAVTWGSGTAGVHGVVSAANSLVGSSTDDAVGSVKELSNGNYVVISYQWDNGAATDAGALTWGSGSGGVSGAVSAANSLVGGSAGDMVGYNDYGPVMTELSNGNYVVIIPRWDNGAATDAGAVTWGSGTTGVSGLVSAANSLVGSSIQDSIWVTLIDLPNGNYVVATHRWNEGSRVGVGAVTWGNGTTGTRGAISAANSLIGGRTDDMVGLDSVTALSNGHYVVHSSRWDNGTADNAGAVTWGDGMAGVTGRISWWNSVRGSADHGMLGWIYDSVNDQVLVRRPKDNIVTLFRLPPVYPDAIVFVPVILKDTW